MNRKTMLLFLGAMTLGCAASTNAQMPMCPAPNNLKLTVDESYLRFNQKPPICVTLPGSFTITIHQPGNSTVVIGSGDVTVGAKASTGLTISGTNSAPINKVTVHVDGDAEPDDEFGFWIDVKGVGKLDPKVRVVGNSEILRITSEALYDTLDTLNLSLDDAIGLLQQKQQSE